MEDILTPQTILDGLNTTEIPRTVSYYQQVGSTMDLAREQLQERPPEELPLLVLADEQTAGRGRMQRPWAAPAGSALLFSLALRPHWLAPENGTMLVWMVGVALCEAINEVTGLQPRLKWPNDVLLMDDSGKAAKLAGILLESRTTVIQPPEQVRFEWAIIGCGINVSASPPSDTPLRYSATHLTAALGQPLSRLALLRTILVRFDHWYTALQRGEHKQLFTNWRTLLHTLGQEIQIETPQGILKGYAEDVDLSGALCLRDTLGTLHIIPGGDVNNR